MSKPHESNWRYIRALNPLDRVAPCQEKPALFAFLPYMSTAFNCISRLLSRHNIKSMDLPLKKVPRFLQHMKGDLGLKTPGVYSVP
jgi:hypothetical protein